MSEPRNNGAKTVEGAARPLPVPMWPTEILTLQQAAFEVKQSEKSIVRLCDEFGIGRRARQARGGRYQISAPALHMVMSDDPVALELLREGNREAPEVMRYLRALQLVP